MESVPEHTVDKLAETGKKAGKAGKTVTGKPLENLSARPYANTAKSRFLMKI